ncbi:amidohydrolase family protein [Halobellus litoreus]|uniref:Amidohydrolase family protein n=1 Tax=Halobellus litoreus TaxID=755310 RepID=A0ABD6DS86_9EURY|nr:amidohydrolase family protein [Halobellus litoreus]
MRLGRFVVETHCHAQRHAVRIGEGEGDYANLADAMKTAVMADDADEDTDVVVYDNSERLLYDMDTYDVDMCVLLSAFGMTNELNRQMIEANPEKFVAAAAPVQTKKRALRGEEAWSWEAAADELDEWLSKDGFVMTGEGIRGDPTRTEPVPWRERKKHLRHVFDVAADHGVPVRWHTGYTSGYGGNHLFHLYPDWQDPTLASQLKAEYPEVPIVFDHGGMQAGWREDYVDKVTQVAGTFDDVYLEIGLYWGELMKKPINDPNIAIDQLLWGSDWGASMVQHSQPNEYPPTYWEQISSKGLPAHQPDYWGANQRQLLKFALDTDLPQDDLNLILGGNAVRLLDLDVPHSRLFPEFK